MSDGLFKFDMPTKNASIIKVIGVGGGGSNAVNHMYKQGIMDVDFVVCNTDLQALDASPVPVKIQLGPTVSEGRGAGNKPERGKQAAIESLDQINEVLSQNTKMVFITAGMGGGTGTGAAPVIAQEAKQLGILTVAIVTIPFLFEGKRRLNQAVEGIEEIKQYVDSLLVINNEKFREIYGDLELSAAFAKADDILTIAAKGIAEIITVPGRVNVDFEDVYTVMKDSEVALMGSAACGGESRAIDAVKEALTSPLLNNSDIHGAKNILLNITSGEPEVKIDEITQITNYLREAAGPDAEVIWGENIDLSLGDEIKVIVTATGFSSDIIPELYARKTNNVERHTIGGTSYNGTLHNHNKIDETSKHKDQPDTEHQKHSEEADDGIRMVEAEGRRELDDSFTSHIHSNEMFSQTIRKGRPINYKNLDEIENIPAYKRRNISFEDKAIVGKNEDISRFTITEDETEGIRIRKSNSYLDENVD